MFTPHDAEVLRIAVLAVVAHEQADVVDVLVLLVSVGREDQLELFLRQPQRVCLPVVRLRVLLEGFQTLQFSEDGVEVARVGERDCRGLPVAVCGYKTSRCHPCLPRPPGRTVERL